MRIAVLIIGLVLTVGLFIQSLLVSVLSDAANTEHDGADGAVGILMALLWLVACGLVIPVPRISMILVAFAGIIGLASAGPLDFPDLRFWGVVSLFLAVLSYFGYRGKRKQKLEAAEKERQMREALETQQLMAAQVARLQEQLAYQQAQEHSPRASA